MLSKLKYASCRYSLVADACNHATWAAELQSHFGADLTELRYVNGGTLGVCFIGKLRGEPRFFKTHSLAAGRDALQREATFLQVTSGERVSPQFLFISGEGASDRVWLYTKVLRPSPALTPTDARRLISQYETRLHGYPKTESLVAADDSIDLLLTHAISANEFMRGQNFLDSVIQDRVEASLDRMASICSNAPRQLCHGDLGPANIMTDGHTAIALDWEDVFWGVHGYDYLYWLSFFDNRKWLSISALKHAPLERQDAVALLIVILLLKSYLSICDGSHRYHRLSIEQRLREVIVLD